MRSFIVLLAVVFVWPCTSSNCAWAQRPLYDPPDTMSLWHNKEFHRNRLPGRAGEGEYYTMGLTKKNNEFVADGFNIISCYRCYAAEVDGKRIRMLDGFTMRYAGLSTGTVLPVLGKLYRVERIGAGSDGRSPGAHLIQLTPQRMPPDPKAMPTKARHPLDETALPVGCELTFLYCYRFEPDGDAERWAHRKGDRSQGSIHYELERIDPPKERSTKPTAHVKTWISGSRVHLEKSQTREHAATRTFQEGDVIAHGIGGVRLRIDEIALPTEDQPAKIRLREIRAPASDRKERVFPPDGDEATLNSGARSEVATILIEAEVADVSDREKPRVDIEAWGHAKPELYPQKFAGLVVGDTFVVYRDYRSYRVHAVVPSNPMHNLVGWIELTPVPSPLRDEQ